jgi:hypothetical protein
MLRLITTLSWQAWAAIAGVVLTAGVTIITLDRRTLGRLANLALALVVIGAAVAIVGISLDASAKFDSDQVAANAISQQTNTAQELDYVRSVTGTTGDKVNTLAALTDLTPGGRFSVVISHSACAADLKGYPAKIRKQFSIPDRSAQVCVMATSGGGYVLVFGRHLKLSAAQVYKTLADSHDYGPVDKQTGLPELGRIEPDLPGECYQFTGKERPCPKSRRKH